MHKELSCHAIRSLVTVNLANEGVDREIIEMSLTLVTSLLKYVILGKDVYPQSHAFVEVSSGVQLDNQIFPRPIRRKGAVDNQMIKLIIDSLLRLVVAQPMYYNTARDIIGSLAYNCT